MMDQAVFAVVDNLGIPKDRDADFQQQNREHAVAVTKITDARDFFFSASVA
jgi:hypothetical protein